MKYIDSVEFDRARAEQWAAMIRERGGRASILKRTLRAAGMSRVIYVVVAGPGGAER